VYLYLSKIRYENQFFNFDYLLFSHCIYVSKDVRVRGYFCKPRGVSEQNTLGNTDL
jgi:hypothetical protein